MKEPFAIEQPTAAESNPAASAETVPVESGFSAYAELGPVEPELSAVEPINPVESGFSAYTEFGPVKREPSAVEPTNPVESGFSAYTEFGPVEPEPSAVEPTNPVESGLSAYTELGPVESELSAVEPTSHVEPELSAVSETTPVEVDVEPVEVEERAPVASGLSIDADRSPFETDLSALREPDVTAVEPAMEEQVPEPIGVEDSASVFEAPFAPVEVEWAEPFPGEEGSPGELGEAVAFAAPSTDVEPRPVDDLDAVEVDQLEHEPGEQMTEAALSLTGAELVVSRRLPNSLSR